MKEPVVIASGRSYEKKAIVQWFQKGGTTDPISGKDLGSKITIPNLNLKKLLDDLPKHIRDQK